MLIMYITRIWHAMIATLDMMIAMKYHASNVRLSKKDMDN